MNISTEFFMYCKAHYSKMGFRRYQQGYSRMTNDVLQNFHFKKLSSGRECTVEFGVFPLCMVNLTPEMGVYDMLCFDENTYADGMGWRYDKKSDESIIECIKKLCFHLDTDLIPFFEKADCCESALCELIHLDYLFDSVRLSSIQKFGGEDCAEKIETRMLRAPEKIYMALKNGNFELAGKALRLSIEKAESICSNEIFCLETAAFSKKAALERRIERRNAQINQFKFLLSQVEQKNVSYIRSYLEQNERSSKEQLEAFFTTR